jgi:hypothetical protein
MGQRPIKWSYRRICQVCIMYFMSPNSKDVWSPRSMLSLNIPSNWNQIWHTRHIPPRFSTNKTESPATRLLDSIKFNGMIILKMKPHGNMRTFYDPTTPTFFHQGNQCQTSPPLPLLQSRGEISLRGRAVTLCVTKIIMKSLKLQLSLKARANQVIEVWNQNLKSRFKFC